MELRVVAKQEATLAYTDPILIVVVEDAVVVAVKRSAANITDVKGW